MVRGLAGILACVPIALSAAQPSLPKAADLAIDGAAMRAAKMPMVVLYSQAGCSYCDEARTYLVPMARDPANAQRALFRQIDIDSDAALTDFAGKPTTHRHLAARLEGRTLGEAIIGMRLPDFYGQYVDNAIDDARAALAARP